MSVGRLDFKLHFCPLEKVLKTLVNKMWNRSVYVEITVVGSLTLHRSYLWNDNIKFEKKKVVTTILLFEFIFLIKKFCR